MKIVDASTSSVIGIGSQTEGFVTSVRFNFSAWYNEFGPGVVLGYHRRPFDCDPYPIALHEFEDHSVIWEITPYDLAKMGTGELQFFYIVNYEGAITRKASGIWQTRVMRSLVLTDSPPVPYDDWVESLVSIAASVETSVAEVKNEIGDLAELHTQDKTSLVAAVNEIYNHIKVR